MVLLSRRAKLVEETCYAKLFCKIKALRNMFSPLMHSMCLKCVKNCAVSVQGLYCFLMLLQFLTIKIILNFNIIISNNLQPLKMNNGLF